MKLHRGVGTALLPWLSICIIQQRMVVYEYAQVASLIMLRCLLTSQHAELSVCQILMQPLLTARSLVKAVVLTGLHLGALVGFVLKVCAR